MNAICLKLGCEVRLSARNKSGWCKKHFMCSPGAREAHRLWRAKQPKGHDRFVHHKYIYNKYGLTEQQFDGMSIRQNGLCAVCAGPPTMGKFRLSVDHCHKTGRVRGLVCSNCDLLLGHAKDSDEILMKAIEYLAKK